MKAKGIAAAAAFLAAPALLAVSPIATAVCNSDDTCLYGNNGHVWLIDDEEEGQTWWSPIDHSQGDNEMDSWRNNSEDFHSCAAANLSGGGDKQTLRAGRSDDDVAPWNSDEVSSLRTASVC